jgi:hypothetical protein
VQLLNLLLGDIDLLERGADVIEREKSPLLTIRDEGSKLVQFMDRSFIRQQNIILDYSAPLGCRCQSFALTTRVPSGES